MEIIVSLIGSNRHRHDCMRRQAEVQTALQCWNQRRWCSGSVPVHPVWVRRRCQHERVHLRIRRQRLQVPVCCWSFQTHSGPVVQSNHQVVSQLAFDTASHYRSAWMLDADMALIQYRIYTVSWKRRDRNVFCDISYKTRAMLTKCDTPFTEYICCKTV